MERRKSITKCMDCGSNEIIMDYDAGEFVCKMCGLVVSSTLLDNGPEWRAFNAEQMEKRTRVGAPLNWTMFDKGLSTIIDWSGRDVYGKKLKPMQRAQAYRMRKWHRRSKVSGSTERNLAFALSELTKVSYKLSLPKNVLETAAKLYRRVIRKRLIRGRSIQGVAAASIYFACRQCNVIRTLEDVANAANISKKKMILNYRFIITKLQTKVPPIDTQSYISKIINNLILSGETEGIALKILDSATEKRLTGGRGPAGIAAAVTYIAIILTGEHRTQSEIAKEAQVTEVTIRNRYKELTRKLNIRIDL
jgi:transcription initiation factor TFIIB